MLRRRIAKIAKVTALSAFLLCSAFASDFADDSSAQLRELIVAARDAETAEHHQEISSRLVTLAEQMEEAARHHHRVASTMPVVPQPLLEEQGAKTDPRSHRLKHADRLTRRAALARQLAEKYQAKAEASPGPANVIRAAAN